MGHIVQITTAIAISFEFVLATSLLAIFASAYPDRFRTALWRDGGNKGWNSDPSYRTYLYANYKEIPPMPLIWDERSTQYSLCVAIITMVLWFVRLCIRGRTLDVYGAAVSNVLYDIILMALWSYSAVIQSSGDSSDPKHISLRPWYLEHGCSEARSRNRAACQAAKASFGLAIFAVLWFGFRCITTCMYGAYMYGKSSDDADAVYFDNEKKCIQASLECS
ncbi:hypothetical protein BU25DRAFT_458074 [Macroventuria anomochaeta]|uniref:Uncharacterized protein n=1 Tax=Macroventuria anomochaeta TaxID=301207 RepID=A0ACB6S249_9PLEO|nr:uncharacterized protein BU25DRAFT_458074 [Macroventuria anomochaeta]KAF2628231.1 hypothetical protein BU25DRAFT_458074 [Macroventuria anomochaeta]